MLTLYSHQAAGVDRLRERPRYYLGWDMGLGKTLTVLSAIAEVGGKTIVVCPKSVINAAWINDAKHYPGLRVVVAGGGMTKPKRRAVIRSPWDVCVCNHDILRMDLPEWKACGADRLVIDEATKCKAIDSGVTKAAIMLADQCRSVWLLAGEPAPNCPTEYLPQMRIVSPSVFGHSYWGAINRYFTPIKIRLKDGREVVKGYRPRPDNAQAFSDKLKEWVWILKKEDCLSLPPKTDVFVDVELGEEAGIYESASEKFVIELKCGERSSIKQQAALMKLRQILGGSVMVGGVAREVGSAKLRVLSEQLDAIGKAQPVVVWAEFRDEIKRIEAMIRERGEPVGTIFGETSHASGDTVKRFQSGELTRLVCHPASAGHGVTLTAASYAVYYSLSFSLEQHMQSRDRIHRIGQHRPCTYLYLIAPDTVDVAMLRVLRQKKKVADALAEVLKVDPAMLEEAT